VHERGQPQQVRAVPQLAPEAKFPVQIDEIEYFVRWLFDNADAQGATRTRSLSAATRQAAT
jgi:hypothetical protein